MQVRQRYLPFEVPEGLCQFKWFHDNSLLLLIISDLSVPGQREILPQRMAIESVVRHDSPQVWVACEEDPEQIIHLPLVPIGTIIETGDTRHWCSLICVCLDPDSGVMPNTQQVVHDLEPCISSGVIDGGDIGDHGELGGGMVFQEGKDRDDGRGGNVDGELIFPYRELLYVLRETGHKVLAVRVKTRRLLLVLVRRVHDRRLELADSCRDNELDGIVCVGGISYLVVEHVAC
jgi:hypothetical protein